MSARVVMVAAMVTGLGGWAILADIVPTEVGQPGTQPNEVGSLETPDKCDNCHGGYDQSVEPAYNWRGSLMANAGRDPMFWATLAVAEQDFDGAGDLCLRCHSPAGWTDGRSTPTDGSALMDKDADGVQCDLCHAMTKPDGSEHVGVQYEPFTAYDDATGEAYLGSGMYVLWSGSDKLGPYTDPAARHQAMPSEFHRDVDFCGTCHDVSNPVVGDLAPGNGAQPAEIDAYAVLSSGVLGSDVTTKAAFNNLPFQYGVVERTFSEFKAGLLSRTPVSDYPSLPAGLRAGALQASYESAVAAGTGGNYEDGTPRNFSCQTCHMRPVNGVGCNKKGAPVRRDLPLHDMTGGNAWVAEVIKYQDSRGLLRLGGGLSSTQLQALDAGAVRARKQLNEAATLEVVGNAVHIVNLTGHKLITGYPEGRRMWLNVRWYDGDGLVREDGAWGPVATVTNPADGQIVPVNSLNDPNDPNTKVYEAHYAMTQEWAAALVSLGYPSDLALSYDRVTGEADYTLGDLAAEPAGAYHETFHFALNNHVAKDNRIPPYGFDYDDALRRNALPVPASQFGDPEPGGTYDYWDDVALNPPAGAVYAEIDLLYQGTSWEYVQFLWLANKGASAFLADEGVNLLDAWLNTGMAEPYVMASTTWGSPPVPSTPTMVIADLTTWCTDRGGQLTTECGTFRDRETVGWLTAVVDENGAPVSGAQVLTEVRDAGGALITERQGFSDASGEAIFTWRIPRRQAPGAYTVTVSDVLHTSYQFDPTGNTISATFTIQ
ncbi:MAG: hypothetical protein P8170_19375 [Gemmatimonadota bacterium]